MFEYHEAFAGQIVANMKALDSDDFAQKFMGTSNCKFIFCCLIVSHLECPHKTQRYGLIDKGG